MTQHMNMAHRALFNIILIIILSVSSICSYGQNMNGITFLYKTDKNSRHGLALSELLAKDVPVTKFEECGCSFGFFYFRVSGENKVDSIYFESRLKKEQELKIIENIKKSEGSWTFTKKNSKDKKYWFIYPFFDLGERNHRGQNCTAAEQDAWENLFLISSNISKMVVFNKHVGAIVLPAEQTNFPKL